ncbi:MAG: cobalt transporter CbiM [Thermostichus sp. DG02_5_bins_236]
MHISDGILPVPLWIGGYGITALLTGYSLRVCQQGSRFKPESAQGFAEHNPRRQLPKAALLTAAFFVASSIHLPIPPASVHFLLNGLVGLLLGPLAYPAIVVGLFFQVVAFGHGGLTTLGINAAIMGIPALLAGGLFRVGCRGLGTGIPAFLAGVVGAGLAVLLFYGVVIAGLSGSTLLATEAERLATGTLVLAHIPVIGLEGLFTSWVVLFLQRVQPDLLADSLPQPSWEAPDLQPTQAEPTLTHSGYGKG